MAKRLNTLGERGGWKRPPSRLQPGVEGGGLRMEQTKAMSRVSVASLPMYLEAWLWRHPSIENDSLEVLVSPMVEMIDPCCAPVFDFLSTVCTKESDWETIEDDSMIFGEARRTVFTLFEKCPEVEHNCVLGRTEDPKGGAGWSITGRSHS